ncbi:filamentous hemagglutinin N-terminal domain-containing protein [Noviherbaspirillum sp. CPCC 100848]|uniref:Filamentous hemagglutinin N-terminal domain-containing protein n=1 Tax=Noviherbaspirillum album TaxID=3080276 RepID=A0ABU6J5L4_9BURK|nr:filamentous hemagglutinin N-terminal domain-containing protein [Noviherbaspirillum sp. CPCC 100848]MEC4718587.1 filamentous hemagglutinin N-terminal domain-containing protein [Noviherbaspirillum sp. CPCC 100848]
MRSQARTSGGKDAIAFRGMKRRLLPMLIAGCCLPSLSTGNPLGAQVVNGQAVFSQQGNLLSITNTPGAIINWQSFSINPGEITRFIQQNPNSSVLNRIVGQDPSQILGALQSNGRVFLVNPNGILFGKDARIDVNGLIASTLAISNEDFINGRMNFKAGDRAAGLKNQGAITTPAGGKVYLIAPNVENSGIINSPNGEVLLAAGHTVQLVDSLDPNMQVVLSAPEHEALNLGQVIAQAGRTGMMGALVKQRGIVNADSAVIGENGKVVFKASRDALLEAGSRTSARGAGKGGEIQVLGERVAINGDAQVNADGSQGGGSVLVGGDYLGKNPSIMNSRHSFVGEDAVISASATDAGDGGKVIVWSDGATGVYGSIAAEGGPQSGNGGFVETSGAKLSVAGARISTSAPKGNAGSWLLDPTDLNVVSTLTSAGSTDTADFDASSNNDAGEVQVSAINSATGSVTLTATNNITVSSAISRASTNQALTLQAGNNIAINNSIDTNGGSLDLRAGGGITQNSASVITANQLTATATAGSIAMAGSNAVGSFTGSAATSLDFKNGATDLAVQGLAAGANAAANVKSGSRLTVNGMSPWSGSGSRTLAAQGDLVFNASLAAAGNTGSTFKLLAVGNVNINSVINSGSAHTTIIGGWDGVDASPQISSSTASSINFGSGSALRSSATAIYKAGSGGIATTGAGGGAFGEFIASPYVALYSKGGISVGKLDGFLMAKAGGDISIADSGAFTLANDTAYDPLVSAGVSTSSGNITIKAAGGALSSIDAPVSATGTVTINSDKLKVNAAVSGTKVVLAPVTSNTTIEVATTNTVKEDPGMRLTVAELNRVNAGILAIGDTSSGALAIQGQLLGGTGGALQHVTAGLSLYSGGAVTQTPGSTIDGGFKVQATGSSVTLTENNSTGVIAGAASSGDFKYRSINGISAQTIDGVAGISAPSGKTVQLVSTHATAGIGQSSRIIGGLLELETPGPVMLSNSANSVEKVSAALNPNGTGTGSFSLTNGFSDGWEVSGITTKNQAITLQSYQGRASIAGNVDAGTGTVNVTSPNLHIGGSSSITGSNVTLTASDGDGKITQLAGSTVTGTTGLHLSADDLEIAGTLVGGSGGSTQVSFSTRTSDRTMEIAGAASTPGALSITQSILAKVNPTGFNAGSIVFRSEGGAVNFKGNYTSPGSGGAYTNIYAGSIGQDGGTSISGGLHAAASVGSIDLQEANAITNLGSLISSGSAGYVKIKTGVPNLSIFGAISAGSSGLEITNTAGGISVGSAQIASAGSALLHSKGNLVISGSSADAFVKAVSGVHLNVEGDLDFYQSASNKSYVASLSSAPVNLTFGNATGKINYNSVKATTTTSGNNGFFSSGVPGSGGNPAVLGTTLVITGGNAGTLTTVPTTTAPPATPTPPSAPVPSLDACIANPAQTGCASVLPTFSQCTSAPATAGCSVVLPTLDQCSSSPALAGCSAVLPTLSQCTSTPSAAGCSVVLPTLAACTVAPSTAGCGVVLPTLSQCASTPSAAGCSAVLPTLAACITTPAAAGCSVVLPTLSQCISTPGATGCSVVLPALATCTTTPTATGCSVVLPTLNQCIGTPAAAGCSAVLPTLTACTSVPATAGCNVVLPTLSQCTSTPGAAGCNVVLPTLAVCTTAPTTAGCTAVLPTLAQCVATPSLSGCSVVVPIASKCTVDPAAVGCSTVLPSVTPQARPIVSETIASTSSTILSMISFTGESSTVTRQAQSEKTSISGTGSGGGNTDEAKSSRKTASGAQDNGVLKNEPAKKLYCN